MISTRPSEDQMATYVQNIIKAYQATTKDQRERGKTWYANAHSLAVMLDETNPRRAAGVIAALSANKRWADNITLAAKAFSPGPEGHVPDVLAKVLRIMKGEDPREVLPVGKKTWWFFVLINNPKHSFGVVVDRHAHDIAVGENYGNANRGLSVQSRYDAIANSYRFAAAKLGILPSALQATVWVAHIERRK